MLPVDTVESGLYDRKASTGQSLCGILRCVPVPGTADVPVAAADTKLDQVLPNLA